MTPEQLSPALSADAVARARERFAARGHVRLECAFGPGVAEALHYHLANDLAWSRAFNRGEQTIDLGPESVAVMERDGGGPLIDAVHAGAQGGFQFLFDNVRVSDHPSERAARSLLIDRMVDALNLPATLELMQSITGLDAIDRADGQATRYLPGHFLTEHDDDIGGKLRLAAYVISLSPEWRTAWGGLLQFHDERGDVTHAYAPAMGAIHLFAVPQRHSVSLVAPFAGAPRYAITGWLRRF